jgi:hypothetical protein
VTRIEQLAEFGGRHTVMAPRAPTIKTLALMTALLAYAAGLALLYPSVADSAAKSASEGNDPAQMQFVAP